MAIFSKLEINKQNKTQLSLSLLLIASPWIVLVITTTLVARQSVFNSVPCWSDELAYWHEVLSFSQKGVDVGYYTINEALPKYLSFGTHGFGTVSVYVLFAKVFGWKAYSIVIANAFFLSLAFLFLTLTVKISSRNLGYILLFCLTYTPIILFSSTSMTELLNFSILTMYVGLLYFYFKQGMKRGLIFLIAFITLISFVRIIYIILFLPLLFERMKEFRFDFKFIISIILWIAFSSLLFVLNSLFVSPYPDSFLNELFRSLSFTDLVSNFAIHLIQNTWNLINPVSENVIQVLQRYFVMFIIFICLAKSNIFQSRSKKIDIDYFIVFLILFMFLLINISAYDVFDWRDYRVIAPVLFGSVLYLIMNNKVAVIYSSLAFNLIGIIFLIISPQIFESFNSDRYFKPLKNSMLNHIEYTPHPVTPFENTIVVQQFNSNTVLNIPAGIGITYSNVFTDKLKSRYIFSENKLDLSTYQLIKRNDTGYLYQKINHIPK